MDALSVIEQAEAMALFYAKKARDLKKAARLAAERQAEMEAVPAPAPEPAALAPAPAGVEIVFEAEVPPYVLAPAPAGVEIVFEAEAAEAEIAVPAHRKIVDKTVLTLAEGHSEIAARVLRGEIAAPLWGTSRYVPAWRTEKHGPDSPLCAKIREILAVLGPMSKGELTERLQAACGASAKAADAQIRELSKMGILLF